MFRLAGTIAMGIILAMALVGQVLLGSVFHLSIQQFAFGGGLVLVVLGIRNLLGGPGSHPLLAADPSERLAQQLRLAVTPIASPLLVGPGAIVTVMLIANHSGRAFAVVASLIAFAFVILVLNYAHMMYRLMGEIGSLAIGRVMQVFIIAIGVRFCFDALAQIFPVLTSLTQPAGH